MEAISLALAGVERLIKLLERGERRREIVFTKFVDDVYTKFQPVAKDYINLFARLMESMSGEGASNEAWVAFADHRREFEPLRRQVEVLAKAYQEAMRDVETRDLLGDIAGFFHDGNILSGSASLMAMVRDRRRHIKQARDAAFLIANDFGGTAEKRAKAETEMVELGREDDDIRREGQEQAAVILELIERRWININGQYAKLKGKYLL
jgi:hypothetical protein